VLDTDQLESERPYLMKLSLIQLRDKSVSEDIVQEVFVAALQGAGRYRAEASVRTWLVSILRNKIADHLRARVRSEFISIDATDEDDNSASLLDELFLKNAHWSPHGRPCAWPSAEETFADGRFWQALEDCVEALPRRNGMVFIQREVFGEEIATICNTFGLSATNVSVMLYRARMTLRVCLERKWL